MSILDKLGKLKGIKEAIRQAIEAKGQELALTVPFSQYPNYIEQIETGSTEDLSEYIKAFEDDEPSSITIPKKVKRLGNRLYQDKTWITNINFNEVETVGQYACRGINITELNSSKIKETELFSFASCSKLKSIQLENAIKLGNNSFEITHSLQEVNIPNVQEIGGRCFYDSYLPYLEAPSLTTLGDEAFHNSRIKTFIAPKLSVIPYGAFSSSYLETFEFNPIVTSIGDCAFESCDMDIYDMSLFANVTNIGNNAFGRYSAVNRTPRIFGEVVFNQPVEIYGSFRQTGGKFNVTFKAPVTLTSRAFWNCNALRVLDCGNQGINLSLVTSSNIPFDSCYYLREVKNFSGVVPAYLFRENTRLTKFDFSNVTQLSSSSFTNIGFEQVEIPNKIDYYYRPFYNCGYLKYIGFEKGVRVTDSLLWQDCSQIRRIFLSRDTEFLTKLNNQGFVKNCSSELIIYTDFQESEIPQVLIDADWLYIDETHTAQVKYDSSYGEYLQAVEEDKKECHKFQVTGELSSDEEGFYSGFSAENYINCPKTGWIDANLGRELILHIKTGDDVTTPQGLVGQANSSNATIHIALREGKLVITDKNNEVVSENPVLEPQTEYWIKLVFNQEDLLTVFLSTTPDNYTKVISRSRDSECHMVIGQAFYAVSKNYEVFKGSMKLEDTSFIFYEGE